jgi:hypothetical protein
MVRFQIRSPGTYVLFIFFGFFLTGYTGAGRADWKFLERDDEGVWLFHSERERHGSSLYRVKTRKCYTPGAVLQATERYGKAYENLDHVLSVWEIDCPGRKFRLLSATFFAKDASIIQSYDDQKENSFVPEDIPPGSCLDLLYQRICE